MTGATDARDYFCRDGASRRRTGPARGGLMNNDRGRHAGSVACAPHRVFTTLLNVRTSNSTRDTYLLDVFNALDMFKPAAHCFRDKRAAVTTV
jgi:hypothetical protein